MKQLPRDPAEPIIRQQDLINLGRESAVITLSTMAVYAYSLARYGMGTRTSSNTFMTLTLAQLLHTLSCRSEQTSIYRPGERKSNPYLNLAITVSLLVQVLGLLLPQTRQLLRLTPITLVDTLAITAGAGLPLLFNDAWKHLPTVLEKREQTVHEK